MSGAFKWAAVSFDPTSITYDVTTGLMVLAAVAAARAAASAAETACRMDAEQSAMLETLVESKQEGKGAATTMRDVVRARSSEISAADLTRAVARLDEAENAIDSSRNHTELREATLAVDRIRNDFDQAVMRKKLDDARRGHLGIIPVLREQFDALREQATALGEASEAAVDPEGAAAIKTALAAAGGALQTSNEKMIAAKVGELDEAVRKHAGAVQSERERVLLMAALGDQAVAESKALVDGLRADETVMRWHAPAVEAIAADLAAVPDIVTQEAGGQRAIQIVQEARERAVTIVREANAAQLKADQRDYIAQSIANTLEEMGFVVGPPQAEHPEHPATATVIHAATASGKNIAISIPVDGNVWYNVQGFPKSTEALVGGGEAPVCDEAEDVINEMHEVLASEFQIQLGEVMWEGKDTERRLRAVKQLPQHHTSSRTMSGKK